MTAPTKLHELIDDALETMELHGMHEESSYKNLKLAALAPPSGEGVELPEPEGSMTWTRSAGVCIQPEPGYTAEQMREYRDSSPKPSPVNGEVMQVMADMVKIVERWPVRWSAEGSRLKDQIEWVRFYNLYNQIEKEQFTTPQPAPVDGDLEALIKAEYGNAMRQLKAEGKRSTQTSIRELAEILALRPTTPPPASQERGGDITCYVGDMKTSAGMRYYVCIERNGNTITPHEFGERYKAEYEVACWDAFFNDKPKPSALDFKPPNSAPPSYCPHCGQRDDGVLACCERYMEPHSSAAESDGDPCIECGADPGEPCTQTCCAAEQAKPVAELVKDGPPYSEKEFSRIIDAHAEQAQAGELTNVHLLAAQIGVRYAADESCSPDVEFYAFTEAELDKFVAALRSRLAGGVTVDDAMVERAWMAYTHRDTLGQAYANDAKHMTREERRDMRAALVAALENGRG